jgi:hypothetical protein
MTPYPSSKPPTSEVNVMVAKKRPKREMRARELDENDFGELWDII